MKVFITGQEGFTGRLLSERLIAENYQVFGLKTDIRDYPSVVQTVATIKPDYVVHLAAISSVNSADLNIFYQVNLFGTMNLLQALDEAKLQPKKIIIASSAYVYGNSEHPIINETAYPKPINHYGASKLAMEHLVSTWFERFPIIITRPFNYTGKGQSLGFIIPKIVAHFREKKPWIELGNIDVIRDISAVDFVVNAYLRLLKSPLRSEIINICSGTGYTVKEILQMTADIAEYSPEVRFNPEFARNHEIYRLIGSNKKLFDSIGEIPIIPLRQLLSSLL